MFECGTTYSRERIHASLGGSLQSYLPHVDGRVVCACLRKDTNPDAPTIILAGTGEGIESSAEVLAVQRGKIPIFIKRGTNRWEYVGEFSVERYSRDPVEIEAHSRVSGRDDITGVIHMASTGHVSELAETKGPTKRIVSFARITVGHSYTRNQLAELWGHSTFHPLARGVVTPRNDNKIILFVTREKQTAAVQYEDSLSDQMLRWEGPTDHFAEERMLAAESTYDEIHLFYREKHIPGDFVYHGRLQLVSCKRHTDYPSKFIFGVIR